MICFASCSLIYLTQCHVSRHLSIKWELTWANGLSCIFAGNVSEKQKGGHCRIPPMLLFVGMFHLSESYRIGYHYIHSMQGPFHEASHGHCWCWKYHSLFHKHIIFSGIKVVGCCGIYPVELFKNSIHAMKARSREGEYNCSISLSGFNTGVLRDLHGVTEPS